MVRRYARFYCDLMDICDAHGIKCTVGDYSTGTPQPYHVPWLADMLREAERRGHYLNYHAYSANNMAGQTDMTAGAEWFSMRWRMLVKDYPRLKVILGECGNSGEHLFRPETVALMQQFNKMLAPYPQVVGAAWWTLSNPDYPNGWKLDDFSPVLSAVFNWLSSSAVTVV